MKVAIRADGLLFLAAETELEAFALREWSATNLRYDLATFMHPRMVVFHGTELADGATTFEALLANAGKG